MKINTKTLMAIVGSLAVLSAALFAYFLLRTGYCIDDAEPPLAAFNTSNLYTIENDKFAIKSDGTNARSTTDGINKAIVWAKKNGYEGVSLSSGTYLIQCKWDDPFTLPDDGIFVPSETVLDLSRATLKMETNGQPAYNMIYTKNGSDIVINGGHLIGDLDSHTYTKGTFSTHEWGCGVNIVASSNVLVQNMKIEKMTGDAVTVRGGGGKDSQDVTVTNNTLFNCRRQGISITGCVGGTLSDNTIYKIKGTEPEYGIDLEANKGYNAQNILITGNVISECQGGSVLCYNGSNNTVTNNTCINGNIVVGSKAKNVSIVENTMKNSILGVKRGAGKVEMESNIMEGNSKIIRE